ncbi:MAG: hypothetical protein NTX57_04640 [Armatimonadetes bacterium]|nr:hypothetical protein [Armatimonadota bacterium]
MMQMQVQQTRTEKEREKRLAQIIKSQGVVDAERELARYEPEAAIPLLTRLLKKEHQRIRHRKYLIFALLSVYILICIGYYWHSHKLIHFPFYIFLFTSGGWRDSNKRKSLQRVEAVATLLVDRVKRVERTELGALLALASLAWESATLQNPVRDRLASLLARTPTDELFRLTLEQRTGLQIATRKAIDEARHNAFFEPLAVAGLLALGSIKDTSLKNVAERAVLQHTRGHVCASAEEYLTQIAK